MTTKNRILKPIAAVTTLLALTSGCFLDSVSWIPTITTGVLVAVSMLIVFFIDTDEDDEDWEDDHDLQGL